MGGPVCGGHGLHSAGRHSLATPAEAVMMQRIRFGYRIREELEGDFEERECEHCVRATWSPREHFVLSCPATTRLRPLPATAIHPKGSSLPPRRQVESSHTIRSAQTQVLIEILRVSPPQL